MVTYGIGSRVTLCTQVVWHMHSFITVRLLLFFFFHMAVGSLGSETMTSRSTRDNVRNKQKKKRTGKSEKIRWKWQFKVLEWEQQVATSEKEKSSWKRSVKEKEKKKNSNTFVVRQKLDMRTDWLNFWLSFSISMCYVIRICLCFGKVNDCLRQLNTKEAFFSSNIAYFSSLKSCNDATF